MHDVSMLPSCGELMMSGMKPSEAAGLAQHIECCSMDCRDKMVHSRAEPELGIRIVNETGMRLNVLYDNQTRYMTIRLVD